jgi:hypothetical protein
VKSGTCRQGKPTCEASADKTPARRGVATRHRAAALVFNGFGPTTAAAADLHSEVESLHVIILITNTVSIVANNALDAARGRPVTNGRITFSLQY